MHPLAAGIGLGSMCLAKLVRAVKSGLETAVKAVPPAAMYFTAACHRRQKQLQQVAAPETRHALLVLLMRDQAYDSCCRWS